ncbi:MAG: hypothetical protein LBR98_02725 [Syntrophomonadaceae bacterium]|jgi:hypothetical protein|nr:hypothetical protein [Syntrophomonadaceae bacterium]
MYSITWYQAVFMTVPQTLLMVQIGFRLFNMNTGAFKTVLSAAAAALLTGCVLRGILSNYIIYVLVLCLSVPVFIACMEKIRLIRAVIGTMMGFIVYTVFKTLFLVLFTKAFKVTSEQLVWSPVLQLKLFYLTAIALTVLLTIIIKKKIILYDLDKSGADENEKDF